MKFSNSNTIQYFNIFLCFSKNVHLGFMISSKKVVIEPTAGVNQAKVCLKNGQKSLMFLFTIK